MLVVLAAVVTKSSRARLFAACGPTCNTPASGDDNRADVQADAVNQLGVLKIVWFHMCCVDRSPLNHNKKYSDQFTATTLPTISRSQLRNSTVFADLSQICAMSRSFADLVNLSQACPVGCIACSRVFAALHSGVF